MAEDNNPQTGDSAAAGDAASNPWADASAQQGSGGAASDPWGSAGPTPDAGTGSGPEGWLDNAEAVSDVHNTLM